VDEPADVADLHAEPSRYGLDVHKRFAAAMSTVRRRSRRFHSSLNLQRPDAFTLVSRFAADWRHEI
jgi:hypothetical protein